MSDIRGLVEEVRRYRQAEADQKKVWGCVGAVAAALWLLAVQMWWLPFCAMLGLGILHDRFAAVPPLGFWEVWVILAGLRFVLAATGKGARAMSGAKTGA